MKSGLVDAGLVHDDVGCTGNIAGHTPCYIVCAGLTRRFLKNRALGKCNKNIDYMDSK